jgi:hypothetical protein
MRIPRPPRRGEDFGNLIVRPALFPLLLSVELVRAGGSVLGARSPMRFPEIPEGCVWGARYGHSAHVETCSRSSACWGQSHRGLAVLTGCEVGAWWNL